MFKVAAESQDADEKSLALRQLGTVAMADKRFDQAEQYFLQTIDLNKSPDSLTAKNNLANVVMFQKQG